MAYYCIGHGSAVPQSTGWYCAECVQIRLSQGFRKALMLGFVSGLLTGIGLTLGIVGVKILWAT